ncbi:hypothetical protein OG824_31915 [Streptomyces prunicolor]|uniref:hypothetical protein n=1 Tax=Streptomyces prunicolor TaxID=67348 RepID=UPI0022524961|nr:hypothetical protein [Streptomyces prunicolor]MCX5239818.1 hypothetical protein [Streptomyces prunicolor]
MSRARADVPHSSELRMVVTRADGTVEDHGVVAAHYTSPLRAAWWQVVGRLLANRRIARSNRRRRRAA